MRYVENISPGGGACSTSTRTCQRGEVQRRKDGSASSSCPARTVCVAAGTSPNVTYEKEYPGTFQLDDRRAVLPAPTRARRRRAEASTLEPLRRRRATASSRATAQSGLRLVLRRQPPALRGQRRQGDGERQGRLSETWPSSSRRSPRSKPTEQPVARREKRRSSSRRSTTSSSPTVHAVNRLTETIVEVVVHAPMAARKFQPGQFYRLQNFETFAPRVDGTRLAMEGLALTGAWVDAEQGLMGRSSSRWAAARGSARLLKPGEPVVLMGPRAAPTEIAENETVLLCGGGLGNAVLFSIARAFKGLGQQGALLRGLQARRGPLQAGRHRALHRPGRLVHRHGRRDRAAPAAGPRTSAATSSRRCTPTARASWASRRFRSRDVRRIIAIGSRPDDGRGAARRGTACCSRCSTRGTSAIGSINSPMQCMMKEVCAQCLQKHKDPVTGKETRRLHLLQPGPGPRPRRLRAPQRSACAPTRCRRS